MALEKPPLAQVSPGQPVTAQGWNAIIDGLLALYDAVLAFGSGVVQVNVAEGTTPIFEATVVGVPAAGGSPIRAVPPFGSTNSYTLVGLTPGDWTIHVESEGHQLATATVTVPATAAVNVALTPIGPTMPDLFAVPAAQAMAALEAAGINVSKIVDVSGREVARRPLDPDYAQSLVLMQHPEPGRRVNPTALDARLVLSVSLVQEQAVEVPSLFGMRQAEVEKTLLELGLIPKFKTIVGRTGG
jgi:hypothetical protein